MSLLVKEHFEPVVGLSVGSLRRTPPRDLLIRFAFGAGVAMIASAIAIAFGFQAGGVMFAFPASLPATQGP